MRALTSKYLKRTSSSATLAYFRVLFGLLMLFSIIRFISFGWVERLYISPSFHFTYHGFEWVTPIGNYTYLLFAVCGLASLMIALGWYYRASSIIFFLSFTYIELMDKTTYLNHYYFISLVGFIMILLPANGSFSIDAYRNHKIRTEIIPSWCIGVLKVMICIVYFYAGLAKLNSDWILHAYPLKIWLPMKSGLPIIGPYLHQEWMHYGMSWAGALFDLTIPFLLFYKRTRYLGFILVVIFHLFTRLLFPIGVFPYVMIASTTIFFSSKWHKKFLNIVFRPLKRFVNVSKEGKWTHATLSLSRWRFGILATFIVFQLLLPFRNLAYPGEVFWTEQGFRFSWRVMLMEKSGYAQFKVEDSESDKMIIVDNEEFLTPFQEKQMSFQPDFILEFAHFLHEHYSSLGFKNPKVTVVSYVALNGRLSQPYVNPEVDLAAIPRTLKHKNWILPFNDEIKGL